MLDDHEQIHDELTVTANRLQRQRLLDWVARYQPRVWAIEGAAGTGALLAQQLVAAGEDVVDVPPALAARVRLLDNEQTSKTDRHDARSVASPRVANAACGRSPLRITRRCCDCWRNVTMTSSPVAPERCADSTAQLCYLAEGHFPKRLRADQAAAILARISPPTRLPDTANTTNLANVCAGCNYRAILNSTASRPGDQRVALTEPPGTTLARGGNSETTSISSACDSKAD